MKSVMDGDDAGMFERGSRLGLLDEPLPAVGVEGLSGRQHLDGHESMGETIG